MLKVLPPNISNLIAAGEVVQRPASVVKELVENSIDAGADSISVIIEDSGKTLINVIDNGFGMTPEEAKLSFERHATSKISEAADLNSILTYGFRGEALPSIAAVSEVTIRTRKIKSDIGSITVFTDSRFISQEADVCPEGCNVSVRNIFYNIPARRKFLKSDNSEMRQIISEFIKIALCHNEVSFKLTHNKRDLYQLNRTQYIKQRIADIEGKEINKQLVDINTSSSIVSISGFISNPEDARKTPGNQYFFINGRYFRSPYLHKSVLKAYTNLIPDGFIPSYFLFLETNPDSIDVNIHPSKTEVKFENEIEIFEILNSSVRESLGKNSFVPSIDFDLDGSPEIPIPKRDYYTPPPKIDFDPLFNPFDNDTSVSANYSAKSVEGYGEIFDDKFSTNKNIIIVQGKYLITTIKSGLLLISIGRAKERILYERYIKSLDNLIPLAQETLFPVTIKLNEIDYSIIAEHQDKFEFIGFNIILSDEPNTIVVTGLPDGFSPDIDTTNIAIDELICTIKEVGFDYLVKADSRHYVALALAKSGAKGANITVSSLEAQLLVDTLFACTEADRTPEGKKCMTIISIEDLDKLL